MPAGSQLANLTDPQAGLIKSWLFLPVSIDLEKEICCAPAVCVSWMEHPRAKERNSGVIMAEICIGVQVPFVGDSSQLFSGTLALVSEVSGTPATSGGVASASGDVGSRP
jgi:hypothetical protein